MIWLLIVSTRNLTRSALVCLALALTLAGQFLLFDQIGAKAATATWPRWNDQIQYLTEAYTAWEHVKAAGAPAGWWHSLTNPAAQGSWHDTAALAIFTLADGPSRSAALALNALFLIAWQLALFASLRTSPCTRPAAWVALGVPLLLKGPWVDGPGSMYDFRLDWMATCALGVCAAFALATHGWLRRGWCLGLGAAVGLTISLRFLTITYLGAAAALSFVAILLIHKNRRERFGGLLASALLAGWIASPALWINRQVIWDYYLVGHFTGPESVIRAPSFSLTKAIGWVFQEWEAEHVGPFFWIVTAATLLITFTISLVSRARSSAGQRSKLDVTWVTASVPFTLFCAVSLILIVHPQKSLVVLGNMSAAWVTLVAWGLAAVAGRLRSGWALTSATIFTAIALGFYTHKMLRAGPAVTVQDDARTIFSVVDEVAEISKARAWGHPSIAVDRITDSLDAQVMRVIVYERHRRWVPFIMTLPTGIGETDDAIIRERLEQSDFVLLTLTGERGDWPYDRQLRRRRNATLAWCETHLAEIRTFSVEGETMKLFVRLNSPGT